MGLHCCGWGALGRVAAGDLLPAKGEEVQEQRVQCAGVESLLKAVLNTNDGVFVCVMQPLAQREEWW